MQCPECDGNMRKFLPGGQTHGVYARCDSCKYSEMQNAVSAYWAGYRAGYHDRHIGKNHRLDSFDDTAKILPEPEKTETNQIERSKKDNVAIRKILTKIDEFMDKLDKIEGDLEKMEGDIDEINGRLDRV